MADLVVVGTLAGVEPRNGGFTRFLIQEEGKQYPVKVDTKDVDKKNAAMALLGQKVKVAYSEWDSTNINERTGQPFKNRTLNQIAVATDADASSQQQQQQAATGTASGGSSSGGYNRMDDRVKEMHILRQNAATRAIEMYGHGLIAGTGLNGVVTARDLVAAAEVWVAYYAFGPKRFGLPNTGEDPVSPPPPPEPEPQEDITRQADGIPF